MRKKNEKKREGLGREGKRERKIEKKREDLKREGK